MVSIQGIPVHFLSSKVFKPITLAEWGGDRAIVKTGNGYWVVWRLTDRFCEMRDWELRRSLSDAWDDVQRCPVATKMSDLKMR
ncbi:hypothetical protein AUM89_11015 [Cronobacter sakazakii]|nr:hypothetical protein [Cronobacter sakazakii]EGT4326210.1 hypothetical protein [Cronobacter sakazakii]EGT4363850.1 hypothetical protein [Cronobacter sakazakii]